MARIPSSTLEIGLRAPAFDLPVMNAPPERVAIDDFADSELLVVVFTCNHCPFAVHVEDALISIANAYGERGVSMVAISSNDAERYPADSPAAMAVRAAEKGFPFPYAYDASQDVARAYGAVCTPDLYVFDRERSLVYHGRIDDTRPGMGVSDGAELREALDQLLADGAVIRPQMPAIGCSIKWKSGVG